MRWAALGISFLLAGFYLVLLAIWFFAITVGGLGDLAWVFVPSTLMLGLLALVAEMLLPRHPRLAGIVHLCTGLLVLPLLFLLLELTAFGGVQVEHLQYLLPSLLYVLAGGLAFQSTGRSYYHGIVWRS